MSEREAGVVALRVDVGGVESDVVDSIFGGGKISSCNDGVGRVDHGIGFKGLRAYSDASAAMWESGLVSKMA